MSWPRWRLTSRRKFASALLLSTFLAVHSADLYAIEDLAALLQAESGITQTELRNLGNKVLARELPVTDRSRSLALLAVVRLETTPAALHQAAAEINQIPPNRLPDSIRNLSLIADPAPATAFAPLKLTTTQQKALRSCRLDKCRMKLSADLIRSLTAMPYRWPEHVDTFTRMYQSALVNMVREYRQAGDRALWTYRDKKAPLQAAEGYQAALRGIHTAPSLIPEVTRYLQAFPTAAPAGTLADFMFWSVLDFGHRPTLTINHALSMQPDNPQLDYLFAIKTIYANHYFGGRASFGALLEDHALGVPGRFFVFVEHLNFDGKLNGLLRRAVSRGITRDVESRLELVRALAVSQR